MGSWAQRAPLLTQGTVPMEVFTQWLTWRKGRHGVCMWGGGRGAVAADHRVGVPDLRGKPNWWGDGVLTQQL